MILFWKRLWRIIIIIFFKCLRSKAEATKTPRALFSFYVDACKNVYIEKENDLMFDQDFCSPLS